MRITTINVFLFQPVMQEHITGYQVHYSRTMMNVTSTTTMLTFIAPSLPVGVYTGTLAVMVTAFSRYGIGQTSNSKTTMIIGK